MDYLSIVAIALSCFSLGLNVGRLLTVWQVKASDSNDECQNGDDEV